MIFPDSKNVIFIWILLRPNFSTKSSGLPDFFTVKLDVIGFGRKPHFWNREISYINALCSVAVENFIFHSKITQILRGLSVFVVQTKNRWQKQEVTFIQSNKERSSLQVTKLHAAVGRPIYRDIDGYGDHQGRFSIDYFGLNFRVKITAQVSHQDSLHWEKGQNLVFLTCVRMKMWAVWRKSQPLSEL